jgi:hypothetical protein
MSMELIPLMACGMDRITEARESSSLSAGMSTASFMDDNLQGNRRCDSVTVG